MARARFRTGRYVVLGLAWFVVVALFVLAWQRLLLARPVNAASRQPPPRPQINGVYLADPQHPALRPEQARGYGVRVVSSVPDLIAGSAAADVVIIDAALFERVDALWLAAQLRDGKVIAALNVPSVQLAALPGYRQPPTALPDRKEWGGRPFFSFVRQWRDDRGAMHLTTGSDYLTSPNDFFGRIYLVTPAGVKASSSGAPTPAPTPPMR